MTPSPKAPQGPDSLDIVELVMAMELALGRDLTDAESSDIAGRWRDLLGSGPDGLDDGDLLASLVRSLQPNGPRGKSGGAAVRPEHY